LQRFPKAQLLIAGTPEVGFGSDAAVAMMPALGQVSLTQQTRRRIAFLA
jgi:hypothetical protein